MFTKMVPKKSRLTTLDDFGDSFGPPWPPSESQNVNISIVKFRLFMKSLVGFKIIVFPDQAGTFSVLMIKTLL